MTIDEPVVHMTADKDTPIAIHRGLILYRVARRGIKKTSWVVHMCCVDEIEDRGVRLVNSGEWVANPEDVLFAHRENAVSEKQLRDREDA